MGNIISRSSKKITPPELEPYTYKQFSSIRADYELMVKRAEKTFAENNGALHEVKKLAGSIDRNINSDCLFFANRGEYRCICVAVVHMKKEEGVDTLRYLLSDGLEKGVGVLMIADVVSWSQLNGCGGKVKLVPDTEFLEEYYNRLGFVLHEQTSLYKILQLDPTTSDRWVKVNDRWQLKH